MAGQPSREAAAARVCPLDVLVIEYPGDRLKSDVILAFTDAVDSGTLRIIDVTFVHKDARGTITSSELAELEEHELVAYDVVDETRGLLSVEDISQIATRDLHGLLGDPDGDRARLDGTPRASGRGGQRAHPTT
ncbi:MAG: hypothetical protein JO057_21915 [Chloroflexi bacterium]|nr:hypothetical protein [Chloroflexota bacterium]